MSIAKPCLVLFVLVVAVITGPTAASAEGLDGISRNFMLPTGELTEPGEVNWGQQQLFMAHTVGIGITDELELDLVVPGIPVGGQAQLRVALFPRESQARLVVGGGIVLFPGIGAITTASATAAYHTSELDVHASVMAYNGQSFDGQMGVLSAGVTWNATGKIAFIADATRFSIPHTECSTGPVTQRCEEVLATAMTFTIGVKILGEKVSGDVGVMLVSAFDYAPLPVITLHH